MLRVHLTVTDASRTEENDDDGPQWRLHVAPPNAAGAKSEMRLLVTHSARTVATPLSGMTDLDALIMFTSGTTGKPKLVPWTHSNVATSIENISGAYHLDPSDATVAAMPLFHGHGLVATLLTTLATGGTVLLPTRGKFSAHTFADDLAACGATWYTAVPTIHTILLDRVPVKTATDHACRLRVIRSCSAPLAPTTVRGWVRSGDLGSVDAHGNLTIRGRIKELINRGGERISPEYVEEVLASHPTVAQAAVFGLPDDLYGERIAAFVVPREGCHVDTAELVSYGRERLSAFEIPERIILTDALPLTAKGSIDRSKIAAGGR
ncbi:hypothetical protein BST13_17220 [Mycobacterium aquaticum]|uniref:Acyl-CoA synthetase n=1 Tax=Mycobacterium aquaticum TaxID=1927124 RepID=A0A1X0AWN1_9MYCO|nr:hypothetical protein BST13_17220 [Mycobacterium aquaticum]